MDNRAAKIFKAKLLDFRLPHSRVSGGDMKASEKVTSVNCITSSLAERI